MSDSHSLQGCAFLLGALSFALAANAADVESADGEAMTFLDQATLEAALLHNFQFPELST